MCFEFDPSSLNKSIRIIQEQFFLALAEFDVLESGLNEIGITFIKDGEEDQ